MEDITKLFCLVDDFCRDIEKNFAGKLLPNGKKPTRTTEIEHSEIMTIILLYQQSPCKNFKTFYLHYLTLLYKSEFPKLPSYTRFVALKPRVLWHLAMLLHWLCGQSENTGISYIDTTPIAVCHAKRISKNKVFAGIAKLSKSTYGWFFGFKLHMVINENGEIHALTLTKGNVDDRIPVPNLTEKLTGLLFGDKGYIAKELFQKLFDRGLKLVTKVKKGMKNTLISLNEKILLRKRSIIETVFGYLKNRLEIEHTRHRSPVDFLVHIFSTLISYSIKSKKPSISYTSFLNPEFALEEAYKLTKKSNGAPGIDGVTFKSIEAEGLEKYLQQIRHELITKTYSQNRNRRKEIPKVGEKLRTLNIPCIRDRIVQSALKLIIEPIFESDFQDGSYGYRPKKKAHEAINRVEKAAIKGNTKCIDVDLKSYFDNVRHHILMEKIARRINDKEIMHLIKLILKVGGKRGIAQGSPISPLLSNIYLNEVDKMLEKAKEVTKEGKYRHIEYARWADDLVILIDGHQKWEWLEKSVHKRLQEELAKLEVEVSQEKTKVVNLKKGETFTS